MREADDVKPDEADDVKPDDEADEAVLWLGLPLKAVAATGAVAGLAIACSLSICISPTLEISRHAIFSSDGVLLARLGERHTNMLESCSQGICGTHSLLMVTFCELRGLGCSKVSTHSSIATHSSLVWYHVNPRI